MPGGMAGMGGKKNFLKAATAFSPTKMHSQPQLLLNQFVQQGLANHHAQVAAQQQAAQQVIMSPD
jgi:hypothetical protein